MTKRTQRVMLMVNAERRQTATEQQWQRGLQSDRDSTVVSEGGGLVTEGMIGGGVTLSSSLGKVILLHPTAELLTSLQRRHIKGSSTFR
jgi:uncharacterized NAD(P)/FAD-binding protein YdhS